MFTYTVELPGICFPGKFPDVGFTLEVRLIMRVQGITSFYLHDLISGDGGYGVGKSTLNLCMSVTFLGNFYVTWTTRKISAILDARFALNIYREVHQFLVVISSNDSLFHFAFFR